MAEHLVDTPPMAPPAPRPPPESQRDDVEARPSTLGRIPAGLRTGGWPFAALLAVALLLAVAVGGASGSSRADDAEAEAAAAVRKADAATTDRDQLRDELDSAESTIGDLEGEVADLEGRVEGMQTKVEDAEGKARAKAERELAEQQAALDARSAELDQRSAGLDAREADITQTEQRIEQNSFGNGVWEVGVDIQPGKYKTAGGIDCYWKKSSQSGDIIANDIVSGPVTVIVEPAVFTFESNDCGTWTLAP